jgi:hypothetical protein
MKKCCLEVGTESPDVAAIVRHACLYESAVRAMRDKL